MNWIKQDWEREADLDQVYAVERQLLTRQEFFEHENGKKKPAKITYKLNGNKSNSPSLFGVDKKRVQLRCDISAKISRRRDKH